MPETKTTLRITANQNERARRPPVSGIHWTCKRREVKGKGELVQAAMNKNPGSRRVPGVELIRSERLTKRPGSSRAKGNGVRKKRGGNATTNKKDII